MKLLEVVNFFITATLFSLFTYEFIIVIRKFRKDSFQFINENKFEELMPPTITFCPAPAYKKPGPFLSEKEFIENKFTLEELFHPLVLEKLRDESLFKVLIIGRTESFPFPFLSQGNFEKFWKETFPRIFKSFPRFGK